MKVEVNINAPELVGALNNLANALGSAPVVESKPVKQKDKSDSKKETKKETPKEEKKSKKEDPKPEKEEKQEAEVPAIEDIRAKTAEVSKSGKKAEIKELLSELGVNAISKIPEEKRAEYLERLENL
ncbi:hypothetical protein RVS70_07565 [Virgibacillus sp. M23]|uniref:hypothetical protein n=1 Tax=Virgibacillus sp. M23 TaxID=3079030 RepID=UPI002A91BD60|nr:hypothetical protein [Virgibacillus sp. M23]MDY7044063.1 hypothetical protein [Virgibacillus sp. M23]